MRTIEEEEVAQIVVYLLNNIYILNSFLTLNAILIICSLVIDNLHIN